MTVQEQRANPTPEWTPPRGSKTPVDYIEHVIGEHRVAVFMKGDLRSPMCGFSATAAGILEGYGADPFAVDVLLDPEVREAIKEYSSWPTIPQIFVDGEFLGGSDILRQMHESGELLTLFREGTEPTPSQG